MERYKVTNTTVKPPKLIDGKDIRTALEKVGHGIKFKDGDKPVILAASKSIIVEKLDPGLYGFRSQGFCTISSFKDVTDELKAYSYQNDQEAEKAKKTAKSVTKSPQRTRGKAKVSEMGKDTYSQDGSAEAVGAINPDGDPNFLVVAKRRKTDVSASSSRDNQTNGES